MLKMLPFDELFKMVSAYCREHCNCGGIPPTRANFDSPHWETHANDCPYRRVHEITETNAKVIASGMIDNLTGRTKAHMN